VPPAAVVAVPELAVLAQLPVVAVVLVLLARLALLVQLPVVAVVLALLAPLPLLVLLPLKAQLLLRAQAPLEVAVAQEAAELQRSFSAAMAGVLPLPEPPMYSPALRSRRNPQRHPCPLT
jgi:hypothetical protein